MWMWDHFECQIYVGLICPLQPRYNLKNAGLKSTNNIYVFGRYLVVLSLTYFTIHVPPLPFEEYIKERA